MLDLGSLREYREARRFARRTGREPKDFAVARGAHLDMLPAHVDPHAGLVLDLGANEGDWTEAMLAVFPGVEVLAVEPGDDPRAKLEARFADVPNVTVKSCAMSDHSGTATYHRTRASVFASLLPPREDLDEIYPLHGGPTAVLETVEVETATLDELVGARPVSVLKLDVQGGELAVLRGGAETLARTAAVLVEVLFVPHYEGDATFPLLHEAMVSLNLELIDMSKPFRLGEGPALWADACYCRRPPADPSDSPASADG